MNGAGEHQERYGNLAAQCDEALQRISELSGRVIMFYGPRSPAAGEFQTLRLLLGTYRDVAELEHSFLAADDSKGFAAKPQYSASILSRISDALISAEERIGDLERYIDSAEQHAEQSQLARPA